MTEKLSPPPFGKLRFLYMGSSNVDRDIVYYRDVLGARLIWNVRSEGTQVAAFQLGSDALILLADHMPTPSCEPIYEVQDLKASAKQLKSSGWKPEGDGFEIPNGPCLVFRVPSGNKLVIFQDIRPDVMKYIAGNTASTH